ncbi:MAG: type II toxin-antitoxin system VapC family toxin [Actinomycetota bacterium]|nr:type II toxin-antitoxin system VapC family toxin [Actinomycetota bacterium]
MILLDTNVLSALMRSEPEAIVVDWLDAQPSESIWTTSVTVFEIRTGLELLPSSRRRRHLEAAFERVLNEDLDQRVLAFDAAAADAAGALVARRQRAGKAVEIRDAQIAGIALARKAPVATRNVRHFTDLGVRLIDPWSSAAGPKR